jgi:hypothetical protein
MESLNSPFSRRQFLKIAGASSLSFMLPCGKALEAGDEKNSKTTKGKKNPSHAKAVIMLWLAGGPSQIETFDPHPGRLIAAGSKARKTKVKGIELGHGFEQLAEQMDAISLIRSVASKEGDHERGTYHLKTGYRMEPTVRHPTLGALTCHQCDSKGVEIPRHISILPGQFPGWGGFLGNEFDAFKSSDPIRKVPDISTYMKKQRYEDRLKDLNILERTFKKGRKRQAAATGHEAMVKRARTMMLSKQLEAFEVKKEPEEIRKAYGDTPFGRGCLAARRLVEVGVRWVEVTLGGWDSHVNNHNIHKSNLEILDPAFASLIRDLKERDMLKETLVVCMGEFGRTPKVNAGGGRDHWPHGFSMALAGGPIRGGQVIGETDPLGGRKVKDPVKVEDISATLLQSLNLKLNKELITPVQRPIQLSSGTPIKKLFNF